ncbi:hypothetical protein [Chloroflexus aggregans]|uniref:Uncharacterized protein n=1 Tax=Chloroflexus aggregans (strain MD-66 / DSM 9485) TaxID=326427 RepID=B8G9H8_CHLAD|nr:hypothetical protein [Chloroflexus aggregans]ACL26331.1 conserved hypothetical protein [Chloroflexus aggregans DSM 9485]
MLLSLHATVYCHTTPCGVVSGVFFDRPSLRLTSILVQEQGLLAAERLVPVLAIDSVTDNTITLTITDDEFTECDPFSEPIELYHLTPELSTITDLPLLRHHARVLASDGFIGRLSALHLDADWQIVAILLHRGHWWGNCDISIPIHLVATINEFAVTLTVRRDEIASLVTKQ